MTTSRKAIAGLLVCCCWGCAGVRAGRPGLRVGADGALLRNGQPFRGIGVNYFDAFYRTLKDPADTSYDTGFAELSRRGIPFVRLAGCGFWPADWKLYFEDKARYFALFDALVRSAEKHKVGLIPSLFWHSPTVPDLVGEPRDQWGNPQSKTHAFMRQYVAEVVGRYKRSPAIWGWEFGNEYNLDADLPNAAKHRPKIVPSLGTPTSRSPRDDVTHDMLAVAFAAFAREVRRHDPHRILTTGNSVPRPSAWHQWKEKSWTQDSQEQFAERLVLDNPDPIDVVSVHVYRDPMKRFGREVGAAEFLKLAVAVARKAGKPLFVGEFGAGEAEPPNAEGTRKHFEGILAATEAAGVPLAALWVYDFAHQDKVWNVVPTNARAYQLDAVAAANQRLRGRRAAAAEGKPAE